MMNRFDTNENEQDEERLIVEDLPMEKRLNLYLRLLKDNYFQALEHISQEREYNQISQYYDRFNEEGKTDFFDELSPELSKLPKSNGSRYFEKLPFKVGIVCDEFLYHSYKDVVNLEYIPADWGTLDSSLDFLIVATAWRGIDDSWSGMASPRSEKRELLFSLIEEAKYLGIPVIFYSKEDPVNYHLFKEIALLCDEVYTSANEMVPLYKEYCNHNNVYVMEFAVNPLYHNPIGSRRTENKEDYDHHVIFAGSWTEKYPVRNKDSARIFEGVDNAGADLTIIDRNLNLQRTRYQFPSKYISNLTYPVEHQDLMNIHRLFRWAINVNSVKYSETMFANRVYELQAIGNLILSNYSVGVNNKFPNVFIINDTKDVQNILNNHSEETLDEIRAKGIHQVMLNHTGYHRINQIAENLGLDSVQDKKRVLVVVESKTDVALENFERQMYPLKELVSTEELSEQDISAYDFITYFSDDFIYEEYHLNELLSGFVYTDVDFITKSKTNTHEFTSNYDSKFVTMFDASVYASHGENTNNSGYNIPFTEIMTAQKKVVATDKKLSVIVPIHNNGRYLEDKCFRSLMRSSIFEDLEIIFVNDGSTDEVTIKIIERLRRRYPDIVYLEFPEGSGSASRPRNEGMKIATSPYITFLDPDNEATGDGYAEMLQALIEDASLDMVVGNIIKEDHIKRQRFNYHGTVRKYNNGSALITDTKSFLEEAGLRAQSIQALIVKREVLQENDIKMVEGAAGQDTLFFQEVMLHCNKALAKNVYVHMYYAFVEGSVTNTLGVKFFDKYHKLEIERIKFLEENHLMKTYLEKRFNFYVKNWYISKIERTHPEEREQAILKFLDIYSMYDKYKRYREPDIDLDNMIEALKKEVNDSN